MINPNKQFLKVQIAPIIQAIEGQKITIMKGRERRGSERAS